MIWWVLFSLFVAMFIGLLLMPVYLLVSSEQDKMAIRVSPWIEVGLSWKSDRFAGYLAYPFGRREFPNFPRKARSKPEQTQAHPPREGQPFMVRRLRRKWRALLRSFQVKDFRVQLDTNDFILNAYLYPLCVVLSRMTNRPIQINFWGEMEIEICLRNTLARVLYAYLR